MNDRETLLEMFARAGVVWNDEDDGSVSVYAEHDSEANAGYFGFFTRFGFDESSSLKWVGAWE